MQILWIKQKVAGDINMKIYYKEGYLYQVNRLYQEKIDIHPDKDIYLPFLYLSIYGDLEIKAGYAHDGPSGPIKYLANHLPSFLKRIYLRHIMRGTTKHDAIYQMIREGKLPMSARAKADKILRDDCLIDGASKARAWWIYTAVKKAAKSAAKKESRRKQLSAP